MLPVSIQREKANLFRQLHQGPDILVLPNAWDVTSARLFEQAGFPAVATTSSGVAAVYGYADGQQISRALMIEAIFRMANAVACPLSADIEAGFGGAIAEVLDTIREVLDAGAVGINIEDSTKQGEKALLDIAYQVELIKAIRELGNSVDIPLVINARTDVYLLPAIDPANRLSEAVRRANAYREAGADCLFFIGVSDADTIHNLVRETSGPVNILATPQSPSIPELAQLGVARVSFGSGPLRATLGYLRQIAQELRTQGTYTGMSNGISGAELRQLIE